jgi:hypothetical protein
VEYEYEMVQIPSTILVKQSDERGDEAARYLETLANEMAGEGWDFYRVDTVGVETKPGCIAALFGVRGTTTPYYVVTFRRLLDEPERTVQSRRRRRGV